jgi:hypothetical protein
MRIYHLAALATVACVPLLSACVPTYGAGYAGGGYGYAPSPAPFVIAGGDYYGRGPYYGGGYGYRRPYGADGDWRGNDPRRYQQQRYNQALVARQQQYNQALLGQQKAYNEAFVARQKAGLPSPPFQAPPFR